MKAFHLKKKLGNLKSGMSGKSIKRKALSLAFCSQLSTLLGRNALSYLEMDFFKSASPRAALHGCERGGHAWALVPLAALTSFQASTRLAMLLQLA